MPLNQKLGLGLVLTLSILYVSVLSTCRVWRFARPLDHSADVSSALGASIAKCVAIGNLGKGDLTCKHYLHFAYLHLVARVAS